MAENLVYNVETRKPGRHWSRTLRTEKKVPAVVYGPKVKSLAITLKEGEVTKFDKLQFDNAIFVFKSDNSALNGLKVLRKAKSIHPVTRRPVHLDFFALDMTKAIRVFVEVRYEGKAVGIKEGGILNIVRRDVEIECLPENIPTHIAIDITDMGIGYSLHASDLAVPEGIKLITLPTETLATIVTVEEEVAAPVAAVAADGTAAPADGVAAAPAAGGAAAPGATPAAAPAAGGDKGGEKKK